MTDYSKMSDFDIDAAVAAIKFPGHKITNFAGEAVVWFSNLETRVVRYCNSWADAGPIAEKNFIGLVKTPEGWCSTSDDAHDDGIYYVDEKPCRAICIVFLMMNESA